MVGVRAFATKMTKLETNYENKLKSLVETGGLGTHWLSIKNFSVFWLDNFAKNLAHSFVKALSKSPSFSSNLWTAFACRTLNIPGIPKICISLIKKKMIVRICLEYLALVWLQWKDFGMIYFHQIWIIPNDLSFFKFFQKAPANSHRDQFLNEFYPIDILSCNISSNIGLAESLKKLSEFNSQSFFPKKIITKVC